MSHHRLTVVLCVAGVFGAMMRLPRIQVSGASMIPTLRPGDRLVVLPLRPRPGRLLVVSDPRDPSRTLIKRAGRLDSRGRVEVFGDNPTASTDSRHFGPVAGSAVRGRPVYRYQPACTKGWVFSA